MKSISDAVHIGIGADVDVLPCSDAVHVGIGADLDLLPMK
jgi:hypothetical protein